MTLQPATSSVLPCPHCASPMVCRFPDPNTPPVLIVELTFVCEDCGTELTGIRKRMKIASAA
ncbi:MAG TPA: hypothetical protein VGD36_07510 [Xanthobacteraceae bacterium]